jgi:DmsE family decaheme c-type cytochrome
MQIKINDISTSWFTAKGFLMIRGCGMKRCVVCGGFFVLLLLSVLLFWPPTVFAQAKMVGSDACKNCHEDAYKSYVNSVHGKKYVPGNAASRDGCEACHGPGSVHVDKGGGKVGILSGAKQMAANCQSCHQDAKELAFWGMGKHKSSGVFCADCHVSHGGVGKKSLKMAEPQLCYTCHKDIRAQVTRQSHHPINEGKVSCSDCHATHGGFGKHMIKADSNNELCFKCHAEKRGPFMWEHAPVEENCLSCHAVHGSSHNALLSKRPPLLCTACHPGSHPSTPYGANTMWRGSSPSNRILGRAPCLNCHTAIHGSNGPGSYGQMFLR